MGHMLTASTALSAISCFLTSVLYYQRGLEGGELFEKVFVKTVEAVEKQREGKLAQAILWLRVCSFCVITISKGYHWQFICPIDRIGSLFAFATQ